MIRRVAQSVQLFAAVAVAAFGVMLFANEPTLLSAPAVAQEAATDESPAPEESDAVDNGKAAETVAPVDTAPPIDGAVIYSEKCASCHGSTGGGGIGPALAGGAAAAAFSDIEDQVSFVRDGRGRMPSFGNRLTDDELRAVVRFTRVF